jgi:hypothetical protein
VQQTVRVLVLDGLITDLDHRSEGQSGFEVTGEARMEMLCEALECNFGATRMDWMTLGDPTLALFDASGRFLTYVAHLHGSIRSPDLDGDVELSQRESLADWLHASGWRPNRQ